MPHEFRRQAVQQCHLVYSIFNDDSCCMKFLSRAGLFSQHCHPHDSGCQSMGTGQAGKTRAHDDAIGVGRGGHSKQLDRIGNLPAKNVHQS